MTDMKPDYDTNVSKSDAGRDTGSRQKWKSRFRINWKLAPLKLLVFLMNGANNALYPFFIIHMLSVGLTLTESGVIFALIPIVGCIGQPLAGALADKLGNYKKVVILFILLSILAHALLGFAVPVYINKKIVSTTNISNPIITFPCSSSASPQQHTDLLPHADFAKHVALDNCYVSCSSGHVPLSVCFYSSTRGQCVQPADLAGTSLTDLSIRYIPKKSGQQDQIVVHHFSAVSWEIYNISSVQCEGSRNYSAVRECSLQCGVAGDSDIQLNNTKVIISGDRMTTFVTYTICRVIGAMTVSSTMQLLDASTLLMAKQHHGDFGIQRTFGLFGSLIIPPLSGYFIGVASKAHHREDYSPAFYLFCSMYVLGAILTWIMDLEIRAPAQHLWSTVTKLVKNTNVLTFIIAMFLVGCCYGALENYLFWYMQNFLGAPKWLQGMTNTVAGISAIPVVATSTLIIKWFGHSKIFVMSLIVYGVRFLAYSFVYDAYLILPVEILEAFTFSLTWVVATVYCGKIAPNYVATLQGIIGAMHYSAGRGCGALIAGILFDHFEPRSVYRGIAGVCFGVGLAFALLYFIMKRKRRPTPVDARVTKPDNMADEPEVHRTLLPSGEEIISRKPVDLQT